MSYQFWFVPPHGIFACWNINEIFCSLAISSGPSQTSPFALTDLNLSRHPIYDSNSRLATSDELSMDRHVLCQKMDTPTWSFLAEKRVVSSVAQWMCRIWNNRQAPSSDLSGATLCIGFFVQNQNPSITRTTRRFTAKLDLQCFFRAQTTLTNVFLLVQLHGFSSWFDYFR